MYRSSLSIIVLFVTSLIGCSMGGGGGTYYPPQIAINRIGVTKTEIPATIDNVEKRLVLNSDVQLIRANNIFGWNRYHYFRDFTFKEKQYRLAIPLYPYVEILAPEGNVVKRLDLPRYSINAAAVELIGKKEKRYLAVYINQQSTSHSSTLYILSDSWDEVYKEHLLGAEWMRKESSTTGDTLIISAETKWLQNGECVSVGGPWRYKVF